MNEVLIQVWEESEINGKPLPIGCSIHLNNVEHRIYVNSVLKDRNSGKIPDVYESQVGFPVIAYVNDVIYSILLRDKSIRLQQYEMNNLIGLKEIEIKND